MVPGSPAPGGRKGELGLTNAEIKASGDQPGDSCNGHTGFLSEP